VWPPRARAPRPAPAAARPPSIAAIWPRLLPQNVAVAMLLLLLQLLLWSSSPVVMAAQRQLSEKYGRPISAQCNASTFSVDLGNTHCAGLMQPRTAINSPDHCAQACCQSSGCQTWQWCAPGTACASRFYFEPGALDAGHDRPGSPMNGNLAQIEAVCKLDVGCVAFTYHSSDPQPFGTIRAYLKGAGAGHTGNGDTSWSHYRKGSSGCFIGQSLSHCANSTMGWSSYAKQQPALKKPFLAAPFSDHMVLQRAPHQAVIYGHTTPGAVVVTIHLCCPRSPGSQYITYARADGTWRQKLPPQPASTQPQLLLFSASSGTGTPSMNANLTGVLFGDVFLCSGQSNMVYPLKATENATAEALRADDYPTIRLFSVGQGTRSDYALPDLQTVAQPWSIASHHSIENFSAVCWFFGRRISDALSRNLTTSNGTQIVVHIPVGLMSSDWGATRIEEWVPARVYARCNRSGTNGTLWNAMIEPLTIGPIALRGVAWYQGEQNSYDQASATQYACLFPELIRSWRLHFASPSLFFGFIGLSTWCWMPDGIAAMRQAQLSALALPNVGFATNADHGDGCNIHPPQKQFCGARLANAALGLEYKLPAFVTSWLSPTMLQIVACSTSHHDCAVRVTLSNVSAHGLELRYPTNLRVRGGPSRGASTSVLNCSKLNRMAADECAWAKVRVETTKAAAAVEGVTGTVGARSISEFNVSVAVTSDGRDLVLLWPRAAGDHRKHTIKRVSYGWGGIPMLSVYDRGTGLPVLPFNVSVPV
jgi:sialate O-acetylesterase